MRLIGNYLSPYVRRVAVSLNILEWSYPAVVRRYNPLVRIPGLVLDDGSNLFESAAILDEIDRLGGTERCLTPSQGLQRRRVVQTTAITVACAEKAQWSFYEGRVRPAEKLHTPWIEHNDKQVLAGFEHLDGIAAKVGRGGWIAGTQCISQADVTTAFAYTSATQHGAAKVGFGGTTSPAIALCQALARPYQRS
jgi:glutathione S-transferase